MKWRIGKKKGFASGLLALILLFTMAWPVSAESWVNIPFATESALNAGNIGGDGTQWLQGLAVDSKDGQFLVFTTDVGGVYRSLDGGDHWEAANIGLKSRGGSTVVIDPNNENRVLMAGGNSMANDANGLYLSENKAGSWSQVFGARIVAYRDYRTQLAFDPSSYDDSIGGSAVVYWSRAAWEVNPYQNPEIHPAIYKSIDGGHTWAELPNTSAYAGGQIAVHPTKGYVYSARNDGFYKSVDGGATYTLKEAGDIKSMSVVSSREDNVYINKNDGLYVSSDSGESFQKVESTSFPTWNPMYLQVNPVNPDRMMICNNVMDKQDGFTEGDPWFSTKTYYTTDGGVTWTESIKDNTYHFGPFNARQQIYAWHPTDEKKAWAFGGDWMTTTTDGGAHFAWANNGYGGVMIGGSFNFNLDNPDLLFVASQDYNGGLTVNGGTSWKYVNFSDWEWGGWGYGAYAVTEDVLIVARKYWDGTKDIAVSRDGGKSFNQVDLGKDANGGQIHLQGLETAYADPTNDQILFVHEYRSSDQGRTWKRMIGANGVLTSNPGGDHELYGAKGRKVVVSRDHGLSWNTVATFPQDVRDVAYDQDRNVVYAATWDGLYSYNLTAKTMTDLKPSVPVDQYGMQRFSTVAVDPVDPSIVYTGGPANTYMSDAAVLRSKDAGQSWEVINRNDRNSVIDSGPVGARETSWIRVNPKTRYAFVAGQCYGFWKIAPPGSPDETEGLALNAYSGSGEATLDWYGNGSTTLGDLMNVAKNVDNNSDSRIKDAYDVNGDRLIDGKDLYILSRRVEDSQDKPLSTYSVERQDAPGGAFVEIAGQLTDTSYVDNGLTNGAAYAYRVVEHNSGEEQSATVIAKVTPSNAAPSYLTVTGESDRIRLYWEKKSGNYNVYRKAEGDADWTLLATAIEDNRYEDLQAEKGVDYAYTVTAVSSANPEVESPKSEERTARLYVAGEVTEISPYITQYSQNFDDNTAENWNLSSSMILDGGQLKSSQQGYERAYYSGGLLPETFDYRVTVTRGGGGDLNRAQIVFNRQDDDNYYMLDLTPSETLFMKVKDGAVTKLGGTAYTNPEWTPVEYTVKRNSGDQYTIIAKKDGIAKLLFNNVTDSDFIGGYAGAGATWSFSSFDNVSIGPVTENEATIDTIVTYNQSFEGTVDNWDLGAMNVADGKLKVNNFGGGTTALYTGAIVDGEMTYSASLMLGGGGSANLGRMLFYMQDAGNGYAFQITKDTAKLLKLQDGNTTVLAEVDHPKDEWATLTYKITSDGAGNLQVDTMDAGGAVTILTAADSTFTRGYIGVSHEYSAFEVDDIHVRTPRSEQQENAGLKLEVWTNIDGESIDQIPLDTAPNRTDVIENFDAPRGQGDDYGIRISGYLKPAVSGTYKFYMASDDHGQLWLSTDSDPANKTKIAFLNYWANPYEWQKYPGDQITSDIYLEAGHSYYVEGLMKQDGGGDHYEVAWTGPEFADPTIISNEYLSLIP
ncbi:VPS10 domain-containing protein [Paenibacillus sp. JDR-2]|uniref:VPS10 domain-containing protein n=1 Tax=Paenibacillus sp. (strain JDR-2) TaxID=324057 RepID=UPI0001666DC6|nr:PA14 domain-containing protein [Paenibacillus sp. JDR-2]ACT01217.1 PA14 domain protein [Paenibacillus sp. JDR-2]